MNQINDSDIAIEVHFICPQTRQPLREASDGEIAALRKTPSHTALEAAWIRSDSTVAYPVQNGIPQLIPSAAIPLANFSSTP